MSYIRTGIFAPAFSQATLKEFRMVFTCLPLKDTMYSQLDTACFATGGIKETYYSQEITELTKALISMQKHVTPVTKDASTLH